MDMVPMDISAFAPETAASSQPAPSPSQNYFLMSPHPRSSPTTSRHTHTLSIDSVSSDPGPGPQDSRNARPIRLDYDDPGLAALHQHHYPNSFFSSSTSSLTNALDMRYPTADPPTSPPSVSSSSAPSLPSTGYATPSLPSEPAFFDHHDYPQEGQGDLSGFTAVEMITMSILDGVEQAICEARDALGRGDKETFSARAQNIVTSVDLIRGISPNTPPNLTSASAHNYRIDALYDSLRFSGHPPASRSPHVHVSSIDGASGVPPESAASSPSNKVPNMSSEDLQRQQAQAFQLWAFAPRHCGSFTKTDDIDCHSSRC
ncbi:hypothetical protein BS47DRAFT_634864 [Hydnum rufescens UP504]|uniref:Uncharacterized protein n=1 Tax=Hydnum rufescens UP504 TaxID=1448309 RepID=A0A9P6B9Z8_9AGAM|nr:hypothetical protein BS47DRAFT_634864 [Hydnum rufescens UP504]